MKTKALLFILMLFVAISSFGQKKLTIHNKVDYICPKIAHEYWLDSGELLSSFDMYEWKITGGHFKEFGQEVKEIYRSNVTSVTVVWDNVKSKDGKAPKGTITLKINDKDIASKIVGEGKLEQEIKSLNDIIPPSLRSSISPPLISFGEQEVRVSLTGPFHFPGIKEYGNSVLVKQYEWKIPKGWRAKTGTATSSGTYTTSDDEIILITDAANGGEVMVRGVNDCRDSEDYSAYSWPITFTRNASIAFVDYPKTIPFGEVNTYSFSVMTQKGIQFEWQSPSGWKINGGGSTYTGSNSVQITTSKCPTNDKVRVRMVKDGEASAWTEFPTTIVLPTINIPDGDITQYQEYDFSLNMLDDAIDWVEWYIDDGLVGKSVDKSAFRYLIMQSGSIKLLAKLKLKGCSNIAVIPDVDIEVQDAPNMIISGPSIVHDTGLFEVLNLPSFAYVLSWHINDSPLASINADGVLIRSGNAKGYLTVSAQVLISEDNILNLDKSIHMGFPDFSLNVIDSRAFVIEEVFVPEEYYVDPVTGLIMYKMVPVMGYPFEQYSVQQISENTLLNGSNKYKFIAEPLGFYDPLEIFEYHWAYSTLDDNSIEDELIVYPSETNMKTKNNIFKIDDEIYIAIKSVELIDPILPLGNGDTTYTDVLSTMGADGDLDPFLPPEEGEIDYEVVMPGYIPKGFKFPGNGRYIIKLKVVNRNYVSDVYSATVNVFSTMPRQVEPTMQVSLYPNPTTDVVTIKLEDKPDEQHLYSNKGINKTVSSGVVEIQLWNTTSLLRTYKTDQEMYRFSISDLPKGVYFVRVIKDGKAYTQKLIRN